MDPEVSVVVAEDVPASVPEVTATPEPVVTPEVEAQPKTFTQEELDAAINKRLARAERKWKQEQQKPVISATAPTADQFETTEAFAEALAERKVEERLAARDAARQRAEVVERFEDRVEAAREKYDDFESVVRNDRLPITEFMAEAIHLSDVGPDIAYFLGKNVKEAARISALPPILQVKELGKIEANLAANPPVKKTSNAPTPVTPVTARTSGARSSDTTDPRAAKDMSTSEWIAAERQRQRKQLEARR